jgi:amino acid transporter
MIAWCKDMPRIFAAENASKVPAAALWLTNIVVQLFVISTYWSNDALTLMLNLTSVRSQPCSAPSLVFTGWSPATSLSRHTRAPR